VRFGELHGHSLSFEFPSRIHDSAGLTGQRRSVSRLRTKTSCGERRWTMCQRLAGQAASWQKSAIRISPPRMRVRLRSSTRGEARYAFVVARGGCVRADCLYASGVDTPVKRAAGMGCRSDRLPARCTNGVCIRPTATGCVSATLVCTIRTSPIGGWRPDRCDG